MSGGVRGRIARIAGAALLTLAAFVGSAAAQSGPSQSNPRAVVYELIDQLQTGQPRPIELSPAVRKVIADHTGNSGVYPALARLGFVTYVKVDTTTPMQRGIVYSVTATHERGASTWQVGIANSTQRIEYMEFKIARSTAPQPSDSTVKPPQAATKPSAPRADAAPPPSNAPATAPAPPPRTATPVETSEACRKFPNLC